MNRSASMLFEVPAFLVFPVKSMIVTPSCLTWQNPAVGSILALTWMCRHWLTGQGTALVASSVPPVPPRRSSRNVVELFHIRVRC